MTWLFPSRHPPLYKEEFPRAGCHSSVGEAGRLDQYCPPLPTFSQTWRSARYVTIRFLLIFPAYVRKCPISDTVTSHLITIVQCEKAIRLIYTNFYGQSWPTQSLIRWSLSILSIFPAYVRKYSIPDTVTLNLIIQVQYEDANVSCTQISIVNADQNHC